MRRGSASFLATGVALATAWLGACGGDTSPARCDSAVCGSSADAGARDGGNRAMDAAATDAGVADGGAADAEAADAGRDASSSDAGPAVDGSGLGRCADWGAWICAGGGAMCRATCGGFELDCFGTACECNLGGGLVTCPPPSGTNCGQCQNLLGSPCCMP